MIPHTSGKDQNGQVQECGSSERIPSAKDIPTGVYINCNFVSILISHLELCVQIEHVKPSFNKNNQTQYEVNDHNVRCSSNDFVKQNDCTVEMRGKKHPQGRNADHVTDVRYRGPNIHAIQLRNRYHCRMQVLVRISAIRRQLCCRRCGEKK